MIILKNIYVSSKRAMTSKFMSLYNTITQQVCLFQKEINTKTRHKKLHYTDCLKYYYIGQAICVIKG